MLIPVGSKQQFFHNRTDGILTMQQDFKSCMSQFEGTCELIVLFLFHCYVPQCAVSIMYDGCDSPCQLFIVSVRQFLIQIGAK